MFRSYRNQPINHFKLMDWFYMLGRLLINCLNFSLGYWYKSRACKSQCSASFEDCRIKTGFDYCRTKQ